MWFHCISFVLSVESIFITGSFNATPAFPTQASWRDWRDFPQAQPCLDLESETAQCSSVCVALSPPDGIKKWILLPKQGRRSLCLISQEPLPHLAAGFSSSPPGVLVLPADSQPTWPQVFSLLSNVIPLVPFTVLYVLMSTSYFNSLATGSLW